MQENLNATISTQRDSKGYYHIYLNYEGITCEVKVNNYGGTQKKRARALEYKIAKAIEGK